MAVDMFVVNVNTALGQYCSEAADDISLALLLFQRSVAVPAVVDYTHVVTGHHDWGTVVSLHHFTCAVY
eukprot:scaffold43077_cov47-Cyclotella_meneghiniana.AAC.1